MGRNKIQWMLWRLEDFHWVSFHTQILVTDCCYSNISLAASPVFNWWVWCKTNCTKVEVFVSELYQRAALSNGNIMWVKY